MDVNLIFKIAAIGIITSVLSRVLYQSGKDEIAVITGLAGTVVVLLMVIGMISKLFDTVKTMFQL
ncbi:MAG: stage sporulation protein [Clostridia bacterium]|jgi:stage III sporulation protein AC|nr:stage sporulation protein [Clostridia bacterium]MDF2889674.1 stage sporulation protein [Clostridia bacterium]